jgi:hypothetical protein
MCVESEDPTATDVGVTFDDIMLIIDLHNKYRAAVDPPASDLQRCVSIIYNK